MLRSLLLLLICCLSICCKADTLHVYFPTDEAFLSPAAQKQLSKIIEQLKGEQHVSVIGYADERGDEYYNDMLSWRRAQSVVKHLQDNGIIAENIKLILGKGEINRQQNNADRQREDRRVDIVYGAQLKQLSGPVKERPKLAAAVKPIKEPPLIAAPANDTIDIGDLEVGQTLTLNNIQFLPGLAVVTQESIPELDNLFDELKDSEVEIQIEGHICCIDTDFDGQGMKLSIERARVVYDYLRKRGIAKDRLAYKGFSNTRKLVPETDSENMAKNRRVEIRVMKK